MLTFSQPFFHENSFMTGFQVMETNAVSNDELTVTIYVGGQGSIIRCGMKRIGEECKMHHGLTF